MAPKIPTKKEWLEIEKRAKLEEMRFRQSLPKAIQNQDEFLENSGYKELTNSFIKDEIKKEVFNTNVPVNFNHLTSIKLNPSSTRLNHENINFVQFSKNKRLIYGFCFFRK